jgi:DNA (cytosine-5)-methyltransferase 1
VQETYKRNFGEKPMGDISEISEQKIPKHDILCAGFPCQPFSSIGKRLDIWIDTLQGLTWFGRGVGSYEYLFLEKATHADIIERATFAHNDLLQLAFEFGLMTLIPVYAILKLLKVQDDKHRSALVYFLVVGIFGYPLFSPVTAFMVAIVAGQLARNSIGYSSDRVYSGSIMHMESA